MGVHLIALALATSASMCQACQLTHAGFCKKLDIPETVDEKGGVVISIGGAGSTPAGKFGYDTWTERKKSANMWAAFMPGCSHVKDGDKAPAAGTVMMHQGTFAETVAAGAVISLPLNDHESYTGTFCPTKKEACVAIWDRTAGVAGATGASTNEGLVIAPLIHPATPGTKLQGTIWYCPGCMIIKQVGSPDRNMPLGSSDTTPAAGKLWTSVITKPATVAGGSSAPANGTWGMFCPDTLKDQYPVSAIKGSAGPAGWTPPEEKAVADDAGLPRSFFAVPLIFMGAGVLHL